MRKGLTSSLLRYIRSLGISRAHVRVHPQTKDSLPDIGSGFGTKESSCTEVVRLVNHVQNWAVVEKQRIYDNEVVEKKFTGTHGELGSPRRAFIFMARSGYILYILQASLDYLF